MARLAVSDLSLLVVEPSAIQQKIFLQHLRDAKVHQVEVVGSGAEALAELNRHLPDLLISSYYLPDMTAVELVHQLRQETRFQNLPFMLVSSETRFSMLDPIRQAGVVAILPKPFTADDIVRGLKAGLHYVEPDELQLDSWDVKTLRVLVVDDSALARRHISRVLGDMGISQITTAENGRDGVAKFAAGTFDLVVTDYNMPEMDGQELVTAIRQREDGAYVPILMVTSEQNSTRLDMVAQAGVSALCDKPFEPDSVRQLLRSVLG
ncbi:response regulator [Permianibacter sp. IMCC34836]|uniref:response regulator n=1 Tax=Permianibacter fluminis TaxID=2738515 RepID=UPI00155732F5|nr:response regulator [Permianibacter fluminis]NQD37305.1 response regulator [Permianibacter fluminis]